MNCWKCGKENPDTYERCWNCRAPRKDNSGSDGGMIDLLEGAAPASSTVEDESDARFVFKKMQSISIQDESGVRRTYSSWDEVPPEVRERIARLGGADMTRQLADGATRTSLRTYESLDAMPPDARDAMKAALGDVLNTGRIGFSVEKGRVGVHLSGRTLLFLLAGAALGAALMWLVR